jgi:hypothetical protein
MHTWPGTRTAHSPLCVPAPFPSLRPREYTSTRNRVKLSTRKRTPAARGRMAASKTFTHRQYFPPHGLSPDRTGSSRSDSKRAGSNCSNSGRSQSERCGRMGSGTGRLRGRAVTVGWQRCSAGKEGCPGARETLRERVRWSKAGRFTFPAGAECHSFPRPAAGAGNK